MGKKLLLIEVVWKLITVFYPSVKVHPIFYIEFDCFDFHSEFLYLLDLITLREDVEVKGICLILITLIFIWFVLNFWFYKETEPDLDYVVALWDFSQLLVSVLNYIRSGMTRHLLYNYARHFEIDRNKHAFIFFDYSLYLK